MFIVMDYPAPDCRGLWRLFFKLYKNEWPRKGLQHCWVCADTSKNNVEESGNLHDWHKRISATLWGTDEAPAKFLFWCSEGTYFKWLHSSRGSLGKQEGFTAMWAKIQTLKFDLHSVVTIIYHSTRILHSLTAFFLLTLPFPMSRHLSQPGDTGNAVYCNTSILSVLSLLLPLLVLSRPVVLSAPLRVEYSGEDLLWRPEARARGSVWKLSCRQDVFRLYAKQTSSWNLPEM